jgi:hypothetical protein
MALFFLVALGDSAPVLQTALSSKIPQESLYPIEPDKLDKWIVESSATTSKELSDSLKLPDAVSYFIVPVTGYFGLARPDLWEWLAAKIAGKVAAKAS